MVIGYIIICYLIRITHLFYNIRSHFILGGLNYYVLTCTYCVHTVLQNTFAAIEVDMGKVSDRFGGLRFKGGLRCNGWINSVIINVITEINYRCNYMQVFLKYKYNVKTCMYTISALYQMINLNVST